MIEIVKTWQTIFFTARSGELEETIELTLNFDEGTYSLCNEHNEMVEIEGDDQESLKLQIKAIKAAEKYINQNLFGGKQ